jgi:hypothetical protein
MREAIFILGVLALLAALTAVKYRRQIAAMIRVWRLLKAARNPQLHSDENKNIRGQENNVPLVNCAKCGAWISPSNAVKVNSRMYVCSASCAASAVDL